MIYEIAGLKVEMQPQFHRLQKQSEAYQSSGEPVLRLNPALYIGSDLVADGCSDADREYIVASAQFCAGILQYGRFFLHASAVVADGEAYLFSAPSGVGKSTHTALWLHQFPGTYILNDDKPVIGLNKKGVSVWGTPFAGKTDLQVNRQVPLRAICFLQQGKENRIERVAEDRAIALVLNNTYRPNNSDHMNRLLDMIGKVTESIDIYEMTCQNKPSAAQLSYNVMKGNR